MANKKYKTDFKTGDKVRVIKEADYHYRKKGDIGVIICNRGVGGFCHVEFDTDVIHHKVQAILFEHLELINDNQSD